MNKITIYEGNSVDIDVTMNLESISGYTGTFYVMKHTDDTVYDIEITGTTPSTGSTISFRFEEEDTDITPGNYLYEVRIVNASDTYTVNSGRFIVLDSLAI